MNLRRGARFSFKEVEAILGMLHLNKVEKQGLSSIGPTRKMSHQTVRNYMSAAAMIPNVSITQKKTFQKTNKRITAEKSLISAMSYLVTVAATSFCFGETPAQHPFDEESIGPGAKKMLEMVQKEHQNAPLFPIHPQLLMSTDDTTLFAWEGKSESSALQNWTLIDPFQSSSARSTYSCETDTNKNGLRVRLTFTMTGSGLLAPLYVAVTGLNDRELKIPDDYWDNDMFVVEVPGFCIGGGVNPYAQEVGYVVFLRESVQKKGGNQKIPHKKFAHYHRTVFLPFVKKCREQLGYHDDDNEIPDELSAVSWCDGDIPQLSTIIQESQQELDVEGKITSNKHSAARSGTEQPCDLSPVFRIIKALQKVTTAMNDPPLGLKGTFVKLFTDLKDILCLRTMKKNALIDILTCLPGIVTKAAPKDNIQEGFVEGGMLDEKTKTCPDLYAILATCRRHLTKEEERLVYSSFPELLRYHLNHGHIPDIEFERLGFSVDLDVNGVEVRRPAGISCESYQRAKTLSHVYQRQLRRDYLQQLKEKLQGKANKEVSRVRAILKISNDCKDKILQSLENQTNLEAATMAEFEACTVPQLKAFIHARMFDQGIIPRNSGWTWPLKWPMGKKKISDLVSEDKCLIVLAYQHRSSPIILKDTLVCEESQENMQQDQTEALV